MMAAIAAIAVAPERNSARRHSHEALDFLGRKKLGRALR
jgi:hypothetical protein